MPQLAVGEESLTTNFLNTRWDALPRFDPEAAIAGKPYCTRRDFFRGRNMIYNDVRRIDGPNEGYLVWAGEWLPYYGHDGDVCDLDAMNHDLRMW
jgi:hypothetical protein